MCMVEQARADQCLSRKCFLLHPTQSRYKPFCRVLRREICWHSCIHNPRIHHQVSCSHFVMRQFADSIEAPSYWYSSNSLPDALDGLPQDASNPRAMRRASEAVVQAAGFQRYVVFSIPERCQESYRRGCPSSSKPCVICHCNRYASCR